MADEVKDLVGLSIAIFTLFGLVFGVFYQVKRSIDIAIKGQKDIKDLTDFVREEAVVRGRELENHKTLLETHKGRLNKHDQDISRLYDLTRSG